MRWPGRSWSSPHTFAAVRRRTDPSISATTAHRLRVEHDDHTLLIHLSGEDGVGWTTFAVDRPTRRWAVAEGARQVDAAREAFEQLYGR